VVRIKGHIVDQKTVILRAKAETSYREEIAKHIVTTTQLYADTTQFYVHVFLDNLDLLNLNAKDLYNVVEKLTLITKSRPTPDIPLHINTIQDMRRSCIKRAFGIAKSWRSNYLRWQERKEKHEALQGKKLASSQYDGKEYKPKKFTDKPPLPPNNYANIHPTFYSGMYKEFDGKSIVLKLWTGKAWVFMKQPINLEGRELTAGYEWGSPTLVLKDRLHLHVPVIKQVKSNGKLVDQAKNPEFKAKLRHFSLLVYAFR